MENAMDETIEGSDEGKAAKKMRNLSHVNSRRNITVFYLLLPLKKPLFQDFYHLKLILFLRNPG